MPQALPPHLRPAGDPLALPRPKMPTPDNNMDYDFDSPAQSSTPKTPKKKKKEKKKKKSKSRRALLQVDRTLTPKEWQTIARSMNDQRRPYAPRPVGRGRVGGWRRNLNPRGFRR